MSETTIAQYRVEDEFLVVQLSKNAHEKFMKAFQDDDVFDFSEFDEHEIKVNANFNVVGPAEIQA